MLDNNFCHCRIQFPFTRIWTENRMMTERLLSLISVTIFVILPIFVPAQVHSTEKNLSSDNNQIVKERMLSPFKEEIPQPATKARLDSLYKVQYKNQSKYIRVNEMPSELKMDDSILNGIYYLQAGEIYTVLLVAQTIPTEFCFIALEYLMDAPIAIESTYPNVIRLPKPDGRELALISNWAGDEFQFKIRLISDSEGYAKIDSAVVRLFFGTTDGISFKIPGDSEFLSPPQKVYTCNATGFVEDHLLGRDYHNNTDVCVGDSWTNPPRRSFLNFYYDNFFRNRATWLTDYPLLYLYPIDGGASDLLTYAHNMVNWAVTRDGITLICKGGSTSEPDARWIESQNMDKWLGGYFGQWPTNQYFPITLDKSIVYDFPVSWDCNRISIALRDTTDNKSPGIAYGATGNYPPYLLVEYMPDPPIVNTGSADNITSNSATVHASVNPNTSVTQAYIQWGDTTSYGNVGDL